MTVKLLACAALLAACAHTRPLSRAFDEPEPGRRVTVRTTSSTIPAFTVQTSTGTGYVDESGGLIDPSVIVRVTDERTLRGAGEGLLIGAGVGAALGAGLGLVDGDDPPCDDNGHSWCLFNFTAGEKVIFGGVMLGSLGAVIGLVAGIARGSHDVYEGTSSFAITPVGPAGSIAGATITFAPSSSN